MPDCELMSAHPQLVRKAVELGKSVGSNTFKLDDQHLSGYLFLSPEVLATGHKTTLKDDAYDEFTRLGASAEVCLSDSWQEVRPADLASKRGVMHTWCAVTGSFVADPLGALATRLLVSHFHTFWKDLDDEVSFNIGHFTICHHC